MPTFNYTLTDTVSLSLGESIATGVHPAGVTTAFPGWSADSTFIMADGSVIGQPQGSTWTADGALILAPSGGAPAHGGYGGAADTALERHIHRRRLEKERERQLAEEAIEEAKDDPLQEELAQRLHDQLQYQQELDELQRLKRIVETQGPSLGLPERVQAALDKARSNASFSRLQGLQREYTQMLEDEEHAVLMTLAMLD